MEGESPKVAHRVVRLDAPSWSIGGYCCKSLKSRSDNFSARRQDRPWSPINMASGLLPKSPVSSSLCD